MSSSKPRFFFLPMVDIQIESGFIVIKMKGQFIHRIGPVSIQLALDKSVNLGNIIILTL